MQIFEWSGLDPEKARSVLARPLQQEDEGLASSVGKIISAVREHGDEALLKFSREFDGIEGPIRPLPDAVFDEARAKLDAQTKSAIKSALGNIRRFHEQQRPSATRLVVRAGVVCEKQLRALRTVGLYVPGGSASLPSTMLMLGVPSEIAGCARRVLCTPPGRGGLPDPAILYAARLTGVSEAFALGGAQAVAAMAYGTQTVPRADKIFGPGNRWVTEAKQQVARDPGGAGIDMPAGPSEVMVIADDGASAEFVAADLLSQAEHGPDSQVMLVSDSDALINSTLGQIERQISDLPRRDIARRALASSRALRVSSLDQAVDVANAYAPEHLILNLRGAQTLLKQIYTAGSVFVGPWSAEALGDYCSGSNHVLPTNGYARYLSGLSVADFMRSMTVQEISVDGLVALGPTAIRLARHEGLEAHARAVDMRLAAVRRKASA